MNDKQTEEQKVENYKEKLKEKYDENQTKIFLEVKREFFLPSIYKKHADENHSLPIGEFQRTNIPEIDFLIFKATNLEKNQSILELGTGSGFFTAILNKFSNDIITVEKNRKLCGFAQHNFKKLSLENIKIINADAFSSKIYNDKKFDRIIFTFIPKQNFDLENYLKLLNEKGILVYQNKDTIYSYTKSLKGKPFLIEETKITL